MKTPNDILKFNKRMQTFRLYQFLHGADLKFDSVKRDLLKETPLPAVETAYSALRREAARAIIVNLPANEIESGYAASRNQKPKTETKSEVIDKNKLRCDHCNKIGHLKKGCFKLIDFPDWYENNPKYQGKGKKGGAVTQTGEPINAGEELGFAASVKSKPPVEISDHQRRQEVRRARRHGREGSRVRSTPTPPTNARLEKRGTATRPEKQEDDGARKNDRRGYSGTTAADVVCVKKTITSSASGSGLDGPPRTGLDGLNAEGGIAPGLGHSSGPGKDIGLKRKRKLKVGLFNLGQLDGPKKSDGLDQVIPMEDDDGSFFDGLEDEADGKPLHYPGGIEVQDLMTRKIIGRGTERDGLYYISEIAPHGSTFF
ncbi:hypothetical protein CASFOL_028503 [Castilleja foliolosa]|uniref:CCHC-type domain-containing protein n=1 Tax=Castilleja foliolosa TaxID=1961234 RepID=A0ABD3CBB9_9LAMI